MKLGVNERLKGKKLYREVWKPVITDKEDYTGLYEVSNLGRVRIVKTGKIKKSCKDKGGYYSIVLCKNGKKIGHRIHRLVAFAFVEGWFEGACVDHIIPVRNGGTNIWTNLRWVTHKENNNNPLSSKNNSEAQKGKTLSEESRKKMSEAKKGEKNHNFGKHLSEETKKKISEAHGRKVICVETGQVFNSIKEAGESMDIGRASISACLAGRNKTASGFRWKYYEDYLKEVNE